MALGAGWEAQLNHWHARYAAQGTAYIARANPPVKMLGKMRAGGRFTAVWAGKGPTDYVGCLSDGRCVAFDAKATRAQAFKRSQVERHQAVMLDAIDRLGGVTGIALKCPHGTWWLDWPALRDFHRASIRAEDLPLVGRRMGSEGWLGC